MNTSDTREIKFRAWDKYAHKMYQDCLGKLREAVPSGYKVFGQQLDNKDFVLLQFTGLLDKNGVEIYEGDVVHLMLDDQNAEIVYKGGQFIAKWRYETPLADLINTDGVYTDSVVGNRYENPELLADTAALSPQPRTRSHNGSDAKESNPKER